MFRRNPKSDWAKALAVAMEREVDEVPSDWLKVSDIAVQMGLSDEQAGKAVTLLVRKGMAEMKKFRIKTSKKTKMVRPTCHYRLISSVKETARKVAASGKS